ncbi:MAG: sulfotransferase domain-containing protein [Acidobacteriota bacterium]|nr:sulfotransferase domain-containing protein [Acidobacteriota bacterium]MDE3264314.1 sulfotransferase domain-containing protein [Acidobacteriota bacterium]
MSAGSVPSRATTVEGIKKRMAGFTTRQGVQRGLDFNLQPTDILIATYPKAGTTLMQQIVHGLRTGGDMDFDEITAVVPWIEVAHDVGLDLDAPQRAEPRAFKTHLSRDLAPKNGRNIFVVRDPVDSLVSFFHFFSGWVFEPGAVSIRDFALDFLLHGTRSGRYWEHLVSWWPKRLDPDTLWLCFEDIVADLPAATARVAAFLGLDPEDPSIEIATRQASIDFMREHGEKFDDHLVRNARNAACGLPASGTTSKVRKGKSGEGSREVPPEVIHVWNQEWKRIVEPATGHGSYEELRSTVAFAKERG